jgi:hypothetical protein
MSQREVGYDCGLTNHNDDAVDLRKLALAIEGCARELCLSCTERQQVRNMLLQYSGIACAFL